MIDAVKYAKAKSHVLEELRTWVLGVIVLTLLFGNDYFGYIEGRIWPVTSEIKLFDTDEVSRDGLYLYNGKAKKHRGRCEYIVGSIEWHLGPKEGPKQGVRTRFYDPPQIRGKGLLEWKALGIELDLDTIEQNSHAYVLHQCPWRPWLTRTLFFVSH